LLLINSSHCWAKHICFSPGLSNAGETHTDADGVLMLQTFCSSKQETNCFAIWTMILRMKRQICSICVQEEHTGNSLKPYHVALCTLLRAEVSLGICFIHYRYT
jgi:hypothetical protein